VIEKLDLAFDRVQFFVLRFEGRQIGRLTFKRSSTTTALPYFFLTIITAQSRVIYRSRAAARRTMGLSKKWGKIPFCRHMQE
jgi:hypothetical protein